MSRGGSFTYTLTRERPVKKPEAELLADVLAETPDLEEYEVELYVEYQVTGTYHPGSYTAPPEYQELEITSVTDKDTNEEVKLTMKEEDNLQSRAEEHASEYARDDEADYADMKYDEMKDEGRL